MNTTISSIIFAGYISAFAMVAHATDENPTPTSGKEVVTRSSTWPDFIGGSVNVSQKLVRNQHGRYVYRYAEQSRETQEYHEAFCADLGMNPAMGEAITEGPGAAAWHCTLPSPKSTSPLSFIPDYIFANAPRGQSPVGDSRPWYGVIRYSSSVGGQLQASLQIDNGRCSTWFNDYFPGQFDGQHTAVVSCYAESPRTMNTRMEGCVPKTCGYDTGSIVVY